MVLRRQQWQRLMPIGDDEKRKFLAIHVFLDQDFASSVAKYPIAQQSVDCALGLGGTLRDNHTFSGGEP